MLVSRTYLRNTPLLASYRVACPGSIALPRRHDLLCPALPLRQLATSNKCLSSKKRRNPQERRPLHTYRHYDDNDDIGDMSIEKARVHRIFSLNPEMFSAVDQEMVDFSARRWVYAGNPPKWVSFNYPADPPVQKDCFPPETRGYLYYQKPLPGEHVMAGGLRFRVVSLDARSFDEGKDLLYRDGLPWRVPLYSLVHFSSYTPLLETLLSEGTLTQDIVAHVQTMPRRHFFWRSAILYKSSDTFVSDFGHYPRFVHIVMPGSVVSINSLVSRVFFCKTNNTNPYLGRIRLRLERSTLPQHANSYHATLRIVEIIDPVQRVGSGDNFEIAEPVEGELIRRRTARGSQYKIYTCKLSNGPNEALDAFFNGHNDIDNPTI